MGSYLNTRQQNLAIRIDYKAHKTIYVILKILSKLVLRPILLLRKV